MTDNQEKTFVRTARACGTREASTLTIRHPSLSASRASSRLRYSISSSAAAAFFLRFFFGFSSSISNKDYIACKDTTSFQFTLPTHYLRRVPTV